MATVRWRCHDYLLTVHWQPVDANWHGPLHVVFLLSCCHANVWPVCSGQNVLLQIGLNLLSLEGMAVHSVRQWVLKCDSCFE